MKQKTVRIGKINCGYKTPKDLFCLIKIEGDRLSISGVEGPKPNGDAFGSCGQINMHDWEITNYADGWTPELVAEFRAIWERWHLNDLTAGSPNQEKFLRENPVSYTYPESHFTKACEALESAGLQPDPDYLHNDKPYSYGSAWLKESIPQSVFDFLDTLPETDKTPAWV